MSKPFKVFLFLLFIVVGIPLLYFCYAYIKYIYIFELHNRAIRNDFIQQVDTIMDKRESVVIPASKLTSFNWERLCFYGYYDSGYGVYRGHLIFKFNNKYEEKVSLVSSKYYIQQGSFHLEHCTTPDTMIRIEKPHQNLYRFVFSKAN